MTHATKADVGTFDVNHLACAYLLTSYTTRYVLHDEDIDIRASEDAMIRTQVDIELLELRSSVATSTYRANTAHQHRSLPTAR